MNTNASPITVLILMRPFLTINTDHMPMEERARRCWTNIADGIVADFSLTEASKTALLSRFCSILF